MADLFLTRRGLLSFGVGVVTCGPSVASGQPVRPSRPVDYVCLRDGRRIAYAVYGDPGAAKVAIYHHGQPSCRIEAEVLLPALARRPGVRVIAFDRPGVGRSARVERPSFQGWAADLAACVDALGLDRFGLIGTSDGAAFALAAAVGLRDRVTAVALASPVSELRPRGDNGVAGTGSKAAIRAPHLTEAYLSSVRRQVERSPRRIVPAVEPLTPAERARFEDPEAVAFTAGLVIESLRCGAAGVVGELQLLGRPWNLELANIVAPVALFHGGLDRHAPPWMSQELARAIPKASVRLTATDGHFSLSENLALEILDAAT